MRDVTLFERDLTKGPGPLRVALQPPPASDSGAAPLVDPPLVGQLFLRRAHDGGLIRPEAARELDGAVIQRANGGGVVGDRVS